MRTHRLATGPARRSIVAAAAGATALALLPAPHASAQEAGARDIQQEGDPCENPGDAGFTDVVDPRTEHAANCLNEYGIAQGYEDGSYRPTAPVTREQMASFLARELDAADAYTRPENVPTSDFEDRDRISQDHLPNVDLVAHEQIAQGYEDNTYRPGLSVTRGQMASFIVREMETITGQQLTADADYFDDDNGTEHESNINVLAQHGIAEGDAQGNYNANAPVTRGQMALFIARDLDALDNEYGVTFAPVGEQPQPGTQTYTATTGGEDATVAAGDPAQFAFGGITADTVDIALAACGQVTRTDGTVTFSGRTTEPGHADLGTVDFAAIATVNGEPAAGGTHVDGAASPDGDVSLTVETAGEGCFVVIVFDDADEDNSLDIDENGEPTEDHGLSGEHTVVDEIAPAFEAASAAAGENVVTVVYDEVIDCTTVDGNASNYEVTVATGGAEPVARDAQAAACVTPLEGFDNEVGITVLGEPFVQGDTVTVTAVGGDDGNTVLDPAENPQPVGDAVAAPVEAA